ncbi:sulfotransferase 2B1-like [Ptychodera flava]|uniref:sulfotransferase 2B1-like n=1 Tax=Ptychodera flava TaxID=63121 RepID=UPI00396A468D
MAQKEGYPEADGYLFLPQYDKAKLESRATDSFNFRSDDVIVVGFLKSGNTWLLEVLKAMYNDWGLQKFGGAEAAMLLDERTVFNSHFCRKHEELVEAIKCEDLPSPRLMRSHLPATLFPCHVLKEKGVKVIYISRNPKDIVVSTYYFYKSFLHGACSTGDWEETVQSFLEDRQPLTPWVRHVGDWFQKGIEDNVLHVTYEEMKRDLPGTVRKIADFLQRPLTIEDIDRVVRTTTVDAMQSRLLKMLIVDEEMVPKAAKGENPFVRKGVVGDWKNHFTVAQSELFDSKIGSKVRSINPNIPYQ